MPEAGKLLIDDGLSSVHALKLLEEEWLSLGQPQTASEEAKESEGPIFNPMLLSVLVDGILVDFVQYPVSEAGANQFYRLTRVFSIQQPLPLNVADECDFLIILQVCT